VAIVYSDARGGDSAIRFISRGETAMIMPRLQLKVGFLHLLFLCFVLFSIFPLWIMIFGSLKTGTELAANPAGFPRMITFENYVNLFTYNGGEMARAFFNGVYVAGVHTFLTILVSALAAFGFAKYRFKGNSIIFACLLATMMVPHEITIPPQYIIFSNIGWLNSYSVQIFPGIANVFALFMMVQYLRTVPNSLLEAARIDGAGHWKVFWKVVFPIMSPALGALSILVFLGKWNDYLWPQIMVHDPKKLPIMVILPNINLHGNQFIIPWELVLAGCVVVTLPIIAVFLKYKDKFMSSVTIGAVKE
jgi:ABC-type glycerol-3-phosphate transport system permease component